MSTELITVITIIVVVIALLYAAEMGW
jgi:hypothetical protein